MTPGSRPTQHVAMVIAQTDQGHDLDTSADKDNDVRALRNRYPLHSRVDFSCLFLHVNPIQESTPDKTAITKTA